MTGVCAYRNDTTAVTITDCFIDDPTCSTYCNCNACYNGPECNIADAELEESVDLAAEIMCQYALDVGVVVKSRSELLSSELNTWLSHLQPVTDEPFRLSMLAANLSCKVYTGNIKS